MFLFATEIRAVDPKDGTIKRYSGPHIEAISFADAERYCQNNGLGYCKIDGIIDSHGDFDIKITSNGVSLKEQYSNRHLYN